MEEVELIDEALESCYKLQNRIATMLIKINDINEEKGIIVNSNDSHAKRIKSSKKRKAKDKKKAALNAQSIQNVTNTNDDNRNIMKARENQLKTPKERTETELARMFSKLNGSFIEENTDAYLKTYNKQGDRLLRRKRSYKACSKNSNEIESTDMLANLNDMILQVNDETLTKKARSSRSRKSKGKNTKVPDSRPIDLSSIFSTTTGFTDLQIFADNSIDESYRFPNSSIGSDVESDDSGFSSGIRSLQEINSTYAKIDKRFIEVKRSVESVVVEMKHVDEIINRQKGLIHINFACADNSTFICRH